MIFQPNLVDLQDFDYALPKEKIALFPLENREQSKLLVANSFSIIKDDFFYNICDYLPQESLLVVNSTKVIAARLLMEKPTGGSAELLCINPVAPSTDPQLAVASKGQCSWECFVGGRKITEGMKLVAKKSIPTELVATIIKRYDNMAIVQFDYPEQTSFSDILLQFGAIPLPPYIARPVEESDKDRYQTVYSSALGSVAAPTAGLHFTPDVIQRLSAKKITKSELILHVGPGTFKPIDGELSNHDMHCEQFFVSKERIEEIANNSAKQRHLIATGTTSLRTLESLYWIGLKAYYEGFDFLQNGLLLDQFEPYQLSGKYPLLNLAQSFNCLAEKMDKAEANIIQGQTKLFILPGYEIQTADMLITNFHLPKSTLLLLVSAFLGEDARRKIYSYALENEYRFLSYGDSSLLIR